MFLILLLGTRGVKVFVPWLPFDEYLLYQPSLSGISDTQGHHAAPSATFFTDLIARLYLTGQMLPDLRPILSRMD